VTWPPSQPVLPPPGWYPDPWRAAAWRWWDGRVWTPYASGPVRVEQAPKGPGIKGGGIAAVGIVSGFVGNTAVLIGYAVANQGHFDSRNPWMLLVGQLVLWTGMVGAVFVASRRHGTGDLGRDFGLGLPERFDAVRGLLGALLGRVIPTVFLVLYVILNDVTHSNPAGRAVNGQLPEGIAGWVIQILLVAVGAPFIEELFFRGLVQGAFTRRIGATSAIFVTAVIFSSVHVLSEGPFAPAILFPMAVVLGYLKERTKRLAPGMVAHGVFNSIALLLLLVPAFR